MKPSFKSVDEQLAWLCIGTQQVIPVEELKKKLSKGKRLRVKLGLDPTAPDLHLGHAVVLSKLKQFHDAGHEVIFLVGDFTARIGDPTGRSKTRPPLDDAAIAHNMQTYLEQVGKILNTKDIRVAYNSEWLSKLTMKDLLALCSKVTLARITEREDFAKRIANHEPVSFHELLYPLMQGYDSVALEADVELGGTDQTFNLLMGRYLQEQYGQEPQVIMTVPLLEGLDGVQKMSKSLGNYIGLTEPAAQAYGKLMSMSDQLMWRYFLILLHKTEAEIKQMQQEVASGKSHPMQLKKQMAYDIITNFWSPKEADDAQQQFEAVFEQRDYSQAQPIDLPEGTDNPINIINLLKLLDAIPSSSEGRRLIEGKAVKVDGQLIVDVKTLVDWREGTQVKVGKHRIYKISPSL